MSCPGYYALGVSAAIQNRLEVVPSGVTLVSTQTAASLHRRSPLGQSPSEAHKLPLWSLPAGKQTGQGCLPCVFSFNSGGKREVNGAFQTQGKGQSYSCAPSFMYGKPRLYLHYYSSSQGVFFAHGRITLQTHLAGATENPQVTPPLGSCCGTVASAAARHLRTPRARHHVTHLKHQDG